MTSPERQRYEITKYPNRRFYDITSRRHVTLSDLHDLVRAGHEIVVTDKNSGRDITNVVLTQIILEHDPPKMELFPAAVLHQAIQMSETSARSFIDRYLGQAMEAFSQSRRQFDAFLRQTGAPTFPGVTPPTDWLRMMMPGFTGAPSTPTSPPTVADTDNAPPESGDEPVNDNQDEIAEMRRQLAALSRQVENMNNAPKKTTRKTKRSKKKTRKKK